jgi:hypothetical protein
MYFKLTNDHSLYILLKKVKSHFPNKIFFRRFLNSLSKSPYIKGFAMLLSIYDVYKNRYSGMIVEISPFLFNVHNNNYCLYDFLYATTDIGILGSGRQRFRGKNIRHKHATVSMSFVLNFCPNCENLNS